MHITVFNIASIRIIFCYIETNDDVITADLAMRLRYALNTRQESTSLNQIVSPRLIDKIQQESNSFDNIRI